jgi:hypothetical protein
MKLKITFLMLLIAVVSDYVSAGPVITMRGGGKNQRFAYVKYSDKEVTCSGAGSLVCPVTWGVRNERGTVKGVTVIDYVESKIQAGEISGEGIVEESVPITWESFDDGFQITVDGELQVDKEYEMK